MEAETLIMIIGAIFIAIASGFFIIILKFINANNEVKGWITVRGKILASILEEKEDSYMYDAEEFSSSDVITYKAKIIYSYEVNGKVFKSKNLYASKLNNLFLSSSYNKSLQKKYTKNDTVEVYVNPKKKSEAALIKTIPITSKTLLAILFLAIGIVFISLKATILDYI